MEKNKLLLIAAILEIIAGAVWCMTSLATIVTAIAVKQTAIVGVLQLILSIIVTFAGVLFCTNQIFIKKYSKEINIIINMAVELVCIITRVIIMCASDLQTVQGLLAMFGTGDYSVVLMMVSLFFLIMYFMKRSQISNSYNENKEQENVIAQKLSRLKKLYEDGAINEKLYNAAREKLVQKIVD